MAELDVIDIKEFTNICNELVTAMGLKILNTVSRENTVAVDSVSNLPGEERYLFIFIRKETVNADDLRDLVDVNSKDIKWVVVTTGKFDSEAVIFGTKHDILLVNGDGFKKMLKDYDVGIEREKEKGTFLPSVGEIESNLKWADEFLKSGNYEKAMEYVNSAIKIKETAEGLIMKSKILLGMKRNEDALDVTLKAISLSPDIYEPWLILGEALSRLGKFEDAEKAYLRAVEIEPNNKKVHHNFANFLRSISRLDEALLEINRALDIDKKDPSLWITKAEIFYDKRSLDEAGKCLDIALELDKNSVDAKILKAKLYFENKDYENAKKILEGIDDERALKLKSKVLISGKNFDEARDVLKTIVQKYPEDLEAREMLKEIDAMEMNQKVEDLKSKARDMLEMLNESAEIPDNYDDLLNFIKSLEEKIKIKKNEDFKNLFSKALEEFGKGNFSSALEICRKILSMDSENVAAKVLMERIENMEK